MKHSKSIMAFVFALSLTSAFAFKPAKASFFTARWQIQSGQCLAIDNTLCNGDNMQPVCSNVFVSKLTSTSCSGQTYQNNH